jgi:ketosteroid isomerase-like protein
MSVAENRALVAKFYALMSNLDFDAMFELMADDATWTVAGNPELFHHSGVATKQQRKAAFGNFTKIFASLKNTIRSMTAEEDRVVVDLLTECKTLNGIDYVNDLMTLLRCRDGKIASMFEHVDQATTLAFERKMAAGAKKL